MTTPFNDIAARVGGPRRLAMVLVGIAAAGAIWGIAQWATAPVWTPLYQRVDIEQVGDLTDRLTQAAIPYKLDEGGTQVLVASSDVAKARVAVAKAGALPGGARPGFELFDQPAWGQTELTQRVNYRRALEGELERTIGKLQGIESAQVKLVLHEAESYGAADQPTSGSVVVKLKNNEAPPPEVVKGIAHLVSSSVEGLSSDHLTIVDQAGRLLTEAEELHDDSGLSNRQLDMQRAVERDLQSKAERLLLPVVGTNNAKVQVTAQLNFDRVERSSSSVDPDRQAISTEQKAEIVPGAQGGAGSTNSATAYQNTTTTESVASAVGSVRRLTVAVLLGVPAADSGQPAPVARTPEQLAQLELLVRSAVGYDSTRGDVVSVVNMPLASTRLAATPPPAVTTWDRVHEYQRSIVGLAGVAAMLVVALVALLGMRRAGGAERGAGRALGAGGASGAAALPAGAMPALPDPAPRVIRQAPRDVQTIEIPSNPLREKVQASVDQEPRTAAKVMRALLQG